MQAGLAPSVLTANCSMRSSPIGRFRAYTAIRRALRVCIGQRKLDSLIDPPWPADQRRLECRGPIRGQDKKHIGLFPESVELVQQPIEHDLVEALRSSLRSRAIRSASSMITSVGCRRRASVMYSGSRPTCSAVINKVVWPSASGEIADAMSLSGSGRTVKQQAFLRRQAQRPKVRHGR